MPLLRNVLKDLVDKRLWPVAVLLVAALVAAPVVLGRSGDDAPAPAPVTDPPAGSAAATDANGTAAKAAVTLDTDANERRHLDGAVRDPFRAPKAAAKKKAKVKASAPTTTAPVAVPATGSTGSSSSGGSSGAATPTATPTATPSTGASSDTSKPKVTTKPKAAAPKADDASDTYHVSLRFGVNGGELTTMRDVARLSPLPSVTDPFFVYLGVLETATTHEKRAVFLVSSDATPNGDGYAHGHPDGDAEPHGHDHADGLGH